MTADYSQIEMRIMAHLSKDEGLIEAFRTGEDLHSFVASRAFGVAIDEVTPELRRRVKAMSYGLAYGLSAYGLAQQLKISTEESKEQMDQYFSGSAVCATTCSTSSTRLGRSATRRRFWAVAATCRNWTAATASCGGRRACRIECADPGERGRHHQGGHDRRRPGASRTGTQVANAAPGA